MGIRQDAGQLILFMYRRHVQGLPVLEYAEMLEPSILEPGLNWEAHRLDIALDYAVEKGFVKAKPIKVLGGSRFWMIDGISASGIDIVEGLKTEEGRQQFQLVFNIKNELNIANVESVFKGEVKLL